MGKHGMFCKQTQHVLSRQGAFGCVVQHCANTLDHANDRRHMMHLQHHLHKAQGHANTRACMFNKTTKYRDILPVGMVSARIQNPRI